MQHKQSILSPTSEVSIDRVYVLWAYETWTPLEARQIPMPCPPAMPLFEDELRSLPISQPCARYRLHVAAEALPFPA